MIRAAALATDLYELTMMAGYRAAGLTPTATFELYVRRLPPNRAFLVAAGLEQALDYLESVRFTAEDIAYLRTIPSLARAGAAFFDDYLPRFRFTGDVWAVDEGTPIFPPTPLLRVTAPLPEGQFVETALLATIGFQTSVASRAARVVHAAAGRPVAEFGSRRAHGVQAGVLAARAAYVGGCASTSNVEAGRTFGIPVSGTMAHSWVTAFPDEATAFRAFSEQFGEFTVLLLDTFDIEAAARSVVASGLTPRAVRIDSGDVVAMTRTVRGIFDAGGLRATSIFVSGDLDEWRISELLAAGAPIDGFGVGTSLSTVSDAPALGAVYKLVEIARDGRAVPVMKRSEGKANYPGRKQVWRAFDGERAANDTIELADAAPPGGEPLLRQVMAGGRRTTAPEALEEVQAKSRTQIARLAEEVRRLRDPEPFPVHLGTALRQAIGGPKGRE